LKGQRPISTTYTNEIEGNPYNTHNGMKKANERWAIQDLKGDNFSKINTRKDKNVGNMERPQKVDVVKANPTNAIMFKRMNQHSKQAPQQHFASYPIALTDFFCSIGCPEKGIVLDPFLGSGTTGISALKQGKSFLGIELNEKYISIAKNRLKKYLEQTKIC